jgi:pyruvate dehydrogenase E1 component beta subunit
MDQPRQLTGAQAICEALDICMAKDENVFLLGLGVADIKGIFGTTKGLVNKYGAGRVMEVPVSENGFTGIAIGAAITGMKPVVSHQRIDFALLSLDQIINNAANWHYMYGGTQKVPLTIRMIIGRGWGQGPQHSQNYQALFMHIPGLKVVMPFSPYEAKGLLISSIYDNNPVIFIEHRWIHNFKGPVPEEAYRIPLGKAETIRSGKDITIVGASFMLTECLKAANALEQLGISMEIINPRTIKPMDQQHIINSVKKTGRLIAVDSGYLTGGLTSEIAAFVSEKAFQALKNPVKRLAAPDSPAPTTRALIQYYYPTARDIVNESLSMLGIDGEPNIESLLPPDNLPCDVPDASFCGPF